MATLQPQLKRDYLYLWLALALLTFERKLKNGLVDWRTHHFATSCAIFLRLSGLRPCVFRLGVADDTASVFVDTIVEPETHARVFCLFHQSSHDDF